MKVNGWLLIAFLGLFAASAGFGQTPPPNDNFSNRIVLYGTDLTFTGTLAGATVEDFHEVFAYYDVSAGPSPTQSVWWSWTAPVSTAMTLEILDSSLRSSPNQGTTALAVYYTTNGNASLTNLALPQLAVALINFRFTPQTLSIPVTAGTEYQIQLIGSGSASYTTRLVATNTPIIVQQPRSRTVYSNASTLFYVVASGTNQPGHAFQWLFNGTNLYGENAPMLAVSNVDASAAGAYSVIVSNSAGATLSDSATLSVSQSNVPVSLAVTGMFSNSLLHSNFVELSFIGENGRSYRLESSTDLTNWIPDLEFEEAPLAPHYTSVFFNRNSPQTLAVVNDSSRKFFRASPYIPSPADVDLCVNHLEQIRIAKFLWQRDYKIITFGTPAASDLLPYFPHHDGPCCPLDFYHSLATSYTFNDVQTDPMCIVYPITHKIEEPR